MDSRRAEVEACRASLEAMVAVVVVVETRARRRSKWRLRFDITKARVLMIQKLSCKWL